MAAPLPSTPPQTAGRRILSGPLPKYRQLRQILLDLIDADLGYDDPLPSEREISERFGIARMTVRQAVDQLVSEGRVYKVPTMGAFVARPRLVMPLTLSSFTKDMEERGLQAGNEEIRRRVRTADRELGEVLRIDVGAPVHELKRLRLADGEPIAVECSSLVGARTPGLLDESVGERSLYAVLEERYGLIIDSGDQTISAGLADQEEAHLLRVPRGTEVLRFQRRSFAAGAPLEYAVSTYRGDRYQLRVAFDSTTTLG